MVPLRVVRLSVPLPDIELRLAADVTTERKRSCGRRLDGSRPVRALVVEDAVVANDRPVGIVAQQIMAWLGWPLNGAAAVADDAGPCHRFLVASRGRYLRLLRRPNG